MSPSAGHRLDLKWRITDGRCFSTVFERAKARTDHCAPRYTEFDE